MNNCTFLGRLTRDPESRQAGETTVVNFSIAVNRRFKKEGQPEADFLRMVAFGKTAEFIEKYFTKGKLIAIVSHVQTGSYDKDGRTIYTTDFVVDSVDFAGSKNDGENNKSAASNQGFVPVDDNSDDDLPF